MLKYVGKVGKTSYYNFGKFYIKTTNTPIKTKLWMGLAWKKSSLFLEYETNKKKVGNATVQEILFAYYDDIIKYVFNGEDK